MNDQLLTLAQGASMAAVVGFTLTQTFKPLIARYWHSMPSEFVPVLPFIFGILYMVLFNLSQGLSVSMAVFSGIVGSIAAIIIYDGTIGKAKSETEAKFLPVLPPHVDENEYVKGDIDEVK